MSLAARCDSYNSAPTDRTGVGFYNEIMEKIEKWQEPDKQANKKALRKPDDYQKKKRGGKRARQAKERFAKTDLRESMNKVGTRQLHYNTLTGVHEQGEGLANCTITH